MTRTTSASQRTTISSNPSRPPPPPPTASGTSTTSPTKLIIFLCDTPIQTVKSQFGTYHDIFSTLFKRSLDQEAEARSERLGLEIESYDVVKGEYPTDEALKAADGVLLTGSAASAYAPLPWIKSLTSYISQLPEAHPHLKVIGICFGHQIVANAFNSNASSSSKPAPSTETQATSSGLGLENGKVDEGRNLVEKSPYGWEIGVYDVELTECGKRVFGRDRQFIKIHQMHQDHVPRSPSPSFHSLGSSPRCPVQGLVRFSTSDPSEVHILTLQGHPEFLPAVTSLIIDAREEKGVLTQDVVKEARERGEMTDEGVQLGRVILNILGIGERG